MIFEEVNWIRSNIDKLNPELQSLALEWYRPFRFVPRFLQKIFKAARQSVRKIPVIVQMHPSDDFGICSKTSSKAAGCKKKKDLALIDSFSTKVSAKALEKLVNDESVKKIWHDGLVKAVLDAAAPAVKAPAVWEHGVTGKGVGVAVLDTGIYPHPDLNGRIVAFKDLVDKKSVAYDDHGHGTHCAGDIASDGSKSSGLYKGMAPGCNLIGVKVLNGQGSGSLSTVIQGVQWCIDNRDLYKIRVISMSLGATASQPAADDPLCQAVELAWNHGVVVCAAAGNEGPKAKTISSPGIDPKVITVGAIDDRSSANFEDYKVANFSSRGPTIDDLTKPDVVASGANIISLRSPNSTLDKQRSSARIGNDYISLSGTSMATPICAGIAALMLESDDKLTPDEVKKLLMKNAKPLTGPSQNDQGSGLVDARGSVFKEL
ncbi:MAG TPA: S8 family peptidase [Bacillota bacterium]|nr:S8 family peptidase [Bacillota bacterium]